MTVRLKDALREFNGPGARERAYAELEATGQPHDRVQAAFLRRLAPLTDELLAELAGKVGVNDLLTGYTAAVLSTWVTTVTTVGENVLDDPGEVDRLRARAVEILSTHVDHLRPTPPGETFN